MHSIMTTAPPPYRIIFNWDSALDGYSEYPQSACISSSPILCQMVAFVELCIQYEDNR